MTDPIFPLSSHTISTSPQEENVTAGETHLIQLIGDEQYFDDPEALGFYRSLTVLGVGPPGLRLPGMTFGIPFTHQTLAQDIPPELQDLYQGMISMGDAADVASVEEIRIFIQTLAHLREMNKTYPVGRLLLFLIGNHDVLHSGTANSGSNFFGLLGIALNLQSGRTYSRDVHEAEVGSQENILDKKKLIDFVYEFFLEEEPRPVQLAYSYAPSEHLREGETGDFANIPSTYRLAGGRLQGENEKNWLDTKEVYKDFWHQSKDGSFNALVEYLPNKNKRPEQAFLSLSAIKMEDLQTANGNHPVYLIGLDTMDYLKDGFEFGGVQGHVSSVQVQLVKAFIAEMKKQNPEVRPQFILGGHFPATDITGLKISGLNEVLSDNDVISYIAGHTHSRGFEDLAQRETAAKHDIHRSTPLPMIVVPAVMDFPNEMVLLKYGVDNPESNKLYFEFTFKGIDWTKIPGLNGNVMHELREIYPYLDSFTSALSRIENDQLRTFANPATPLYDKIYLALSLDEGLLTRPGAISDFVIANDVIPTMVENNILYKRIFMSMVKLNLMELGLGNETDTLFNAYTLRLEHLVDYYEKIRKENYLETDGVHMDVHELDKYEEMLDNEIRQLEERGKTLSDEERKKLEEIVHILRMMQQDLNYFKDWLIRFEKLRRSRARDEDYRKMTDLFGNHYFKAIRSHLWEMPLGTSASAFATLVHLESAKMYRDYRKPLASQVLSEEAVPDQIRVEVSTETGNISYQTKDLPDPPLLPIFEIPEEKREEETPSPKTGYRIPWHWQLRTGAYLGKGTTFSDGGTDTSGYDNGYHLDFGGQAHLLSLPKAPRINAQVNLGANLEFQNRNTPVDGGIAENTTINIDVPLQGAVTIGDPFGLFDLGPVVEVGPSFVQFDENPLDGSNGPFIPTLLTGLGVHLNLLEGALWAQYLEEEYHGNPYSMDEWSVMVGLDPLQLARWANLRNRDR